MNFVQPIRDPDLIQQIELYFKNKNERDYILFLVGIYTGLRITDILNLKVKDLRNKNFLTIKERKTKRKKYKERTIELHPALKRALKSFLKNKQGYEYVFKSRVGKNKPITRERAYMILKEAAKEFDIDSLACHSMRKTMGFHLYKKTKNLVLVQQALNHEDASYTLRYIGIEQDTVNDAITKLKYY
ncbi:tyrosine-type recombinase/integrase [Cytobacillus sp. Hm23]